MLLRLTQGLDTAAATQFYVTSFRNTSNLLEKASKGMKLLVNLVTSKDCFSSWERGNANNQPFLIIGSTNSLFQYFRFVSSLLSGHQDTPGMFSLSSTGRSRRCLVALRFLCRYWGRSATLICPMLWGGCGYLLLRKSVGFCESVLWGVNPSWCWFKLSLMRHSMSMYRVWGLSPGAVELFRPVLHWGK